jgi:PGAP1-like protein
VPAKRAHAVVFIHGLARKPPPDELRRIWLWGLSRANPKPDVFPGANPGIDLSTQGVPQRLNYWADVFYGSDYEMDLGSYYEAYESNELEMDALDRIEPELDLPKPVTPRERAFLRDFEAKLVASAVLAPLPMEASVASARPGVAAAAVEPSPYEIASWLPDPVKQAIIKKAAMEAFYFLFDKEYVRKDGRSFSVRQELRKRLLDELAQAREHAEKVAIVSHSMGTMVAYDVLRNCAECPQVDTLITLGSPLGVREVQEELIAVDADDVDFPAARLRQWINVYDPLDPVCGADPELANDFRPVDGKRVVDVLESNWGSWRHTITHYFAGTQFRRHLAQSLGIA